MEGFAVKNSELELENTCLKALLASFVISSSRIAQQVEMGLCPMMNSFLTVHI